MRKFILLFAVVYSSLPLSFAILSLLTNTHIANAATFTVTKTADTNDGTCDADCSLREAIIAANADTTPDTITLGAGTYLLTLSSTYENAAANGDLDIRSDVTLIGAGAEQTIIDGSGLPPDGKDGILHILAATQNSTQTVTIAGVTIQNASQNAGIYIGDVNDATFHSNVTVRNSKVISNVSEYWLSGGGIYLSFGKLTLENSLVAYNQATEGGGIFSIGSPVTIRNSIIEENRTNNGDNPAPGGGIAFRSGALLIQQSKIRNNIATRTTVNLGGGCGASDGGGIYIIDTGFGETTLQLLESEVVSNTASAPASACSTPTGGGVYAGTIKGVLVEDSSILSNTAGFAGGLFTSASIGSLRIRNSTISYNHATALPESQTFKGMAGGLYTGNNAEISNSTLNYNSATADGGAIYGSAITVTQSTIAYNTAGGYGGGIAGTPSVTNSSIHHNSAHDGGGIVFILGGSVERSALYENVATQDGGGIYLLYGGKDDEGRTVTIPVLNSTISGNRAKNGGAFSNSGAAKTTSGLPGSAHTLFRNTTIFGNSATNSGGGLHHHACCEIEIENSIVANNGVAGDCGGEVNAGGFVSLGHNLTGDVTCSSFSATGDVNNSNPLLGPLQNNGGSTLTHEPLANSPVVDSGNNATCLATDQRGILRPQGVGCDKGAFEFVPDAPIFVSPKKLHFAIQLGSNQPLTQSFEIRNNTGGTLNWTLNETIPWLTLSTNSGSDDAVVVVTVSGNGLSAGTYTGTITVQAPGVDGSQQTIAVSLSVNQEATGTVTPVNGGAIETNDGKLKLTFPPASVNAITTVTTTLISTPARPLQLSCSNQENCSYAGVAVQLSAANGDGEMVTSFSQPYLLVLSYDPAALAAKEIEEASLQWWRWTDNQWVQASCVCTVDTANNKFTIQATSFSEYALFGVQASPTYVLTVNKTGNGEVTLNPPGGVYAAGTDVQISATPDVGFSFSGWSGAVDGAANPITVTMDSNKTVTVTFIPSSEVRSVYLPLIGK